MKVVMRILTSPILVVLGIVMLIAFFPIKCIIHCFYDAKINIYTSNK